MSRPARSRSRRGTFTRTPSPSLSPSPRTLAPRPHDTRGGRARAQPAFPPGAPLPVVPGLTGPGGEPRQWAFPVGYNIAQRPRATEQTSFQQLRSLAALYDGVQL